MGVSIVWGKVSMLCVGGSERGFDVIDGDGWVAMATGRKIDSSLQDKL